jgi:hypothetical protein
MTTTDTPTAARQAHKAHKALHRVPLAYRPIIHTALADGWRIHSHRRRIRLCAPRGGIVTIPHDNGTATA